MAFRNTTKEVRMPNPAPGPIYPWARVGISSRSAKIMNLRKTPPVCIEKQLYSRDYTE